MRNSFSLVRSNRHVVQLCCVLSFVLGADGWKAFRPAARLIPVPLSPEVDMNATGIITNRGYPHEVHKVTTDDGYILQLHRIPHGRNQVVDPAASKRVVFLQHGLLGSSADWVINPTNNSLPFILADQGYDVWLGNARGNTYSRQHLSLDPSQEAFWNFSWDEMGKYDIPSAVSYVLSTSGRSKLVYIGHSMGTTMFWVAMITHPELNGKIDLMIALAPISSVAHMRSPVRYLAPFQTQIQLFYRLIGGRVFLDATEPVNQLQRTFCDASISHLLICRNVMLLIGGANSLNFVPGILPVLFAHNPAGTSIRTVAQYAQNYNAGETFIPYDYGASGNVARYGSAKPPPYDLSKVTAPVYIYWGQNDNLATPEDVQWLVGRLPNLKANNRVPFSMFNHYDFVWAYDAKTVLYDSVVDVLKNN